MNDLLSALIDFGALPAAAAGTLLGLLAGWALANALRGRVTVPERLDHSWLRSLPLTPLLALGAILLPHFITSEILIILLLAALLVPPALLGFLLRQEDRAGFAAARRDVIMIALAYLASGFIRALTDISIHEQLNLHLPRIFPALVLGIGLGLLAGYLLYLLHGQIVKTSTARHERGAFNPVIEPVLNSTQGMLEAVLTQFHASALTGVLVILAAALPFTMLDQTIALALFMFVPVLSAMLAGLLTVNPAPNQPGFWQHARRGLNNVAQIGAAFVVGALLLVPMAIIHEWITAQPEQVGDALQTHLELTFSALLYSLGLGLVGGILTSRVDLLRTLLINLGNVGRTIPSLAVLALALPIFGVGFAPSLIALIFIGTLPILVNTSVGIIEVSDDIKEAARGMGMNDLQVLFRVEVPIAIPVIMAGVRTSAVLVVASAVLAGFIGGGGLGALIIRGDGSGRDDILFTGAILATILAIFLEYLFSWLEKLLTPRGLRER